VIRIYESKIDSINKRNTILLEDISNLNCQVDSLKELKLKIYWRYAKEVKNIYDADAINHAQWMDTTLTKLRYTQ
jgi:hypothetical protein